MSELLTFFPTRLYRAEIGADLALDELEAIAYSLAEDDEAGIAWCAQNHYPGYTSYASLNDLPWRFDPIRRLQKRVDTEVAHFAKALEFDLGDGKLALDSLWVNILPEGGFHAAHIHPHSVISGTFYVCVPEGTSALRLEDPRHAMMMAAPPKLKTAAPENRAFVSVEPKPGTLLLWESWLRHDVPVNAAEDERISISFNYAWK